jgi:hypothetical protein
LPPRLRRLDSGVFAGCEYAAFRFRLFDVDALHAPVAAHQAAAAFRAPLHVAELAFERPVELVQIEPLEHADRHRAMRRAHERIAAIHMQRAPFGQLEPEMTRLIRIAAAFAGR